MAATLKRRKIHMISVVCVFITTLYPKLASMEERSNPNVFIVEKLSTLKLYCFHIMQVRANKLHIKNFFPYKLTFYSRNCIKIFYVLFDFFKKL